MSLFDNPRFRRRQRIKRAVACTVLGAMALALLLWFMPYSTPVRIDGPAWRMDAEAGDDTSYMLSVDAKYKRYLLRNDKFTGRISIKSTDGRVVTDVRYDQGLLPYRIPEFKDGKEVKGGGIVLDVFLPFLESIKPSVDLRQQKSKLGHLYLAPDGKSAVISVTSYSYDDGGGGIEGPTTFYAAPATSREEAQQIYDSVNRVLRISEVLPLD